MIRKIAFVAAIVATPALAQTASSPMVKPAAPATAPTQVKQSVNPAQIDINSASGEQLRATKGLGKTYAEAIIKGRPYRSADELLKNKILPENVYEQVKDQLTVRQN